MIHKNWSINDILALSYLKGLNLSNISEIVNNNDSLDSFLNNPYLKIKYPRFLQGTIFDSEIKTAQSLAEKQSEKCETSGVKIVTLWDADYPSLLKETIAPPVILFIKGILQTPESVSIAIVGTRTCSVYGKLVTEKYSEYIALNNVIVTSGMAYGIDANAHNSTIKNKGITYAVIASGIDCLGMNSRDSQALANKIVESGGAIISEYKCGIKALPAYFPQRNRIISGISLATIVVESGEKGGALITARFASDQQREVFAVPGNISALKSIGTNQLIRKNLASITISPEDVFESLGLKKSTSSVMFNEKKNEFFNIKERKLYDVITYEPTQIDELSDKSGFDMSELLVILLNLEFRGIIKQLPGKYYIKK